MLSSFTGVSKFGRRRITPAIAASLVLELDAVGYSGSGAWQDTTANNNDATLQGTPRHVDGSGAFFDLVPGDGDYFTISDQTVLDSMSEISILMWINIDTINAAGPNMLYSKRTSTSNGYVGFFTTTGWTFRFGTGTGTGLTYGTAPTVNVWQQVVVTIGASGSKMYINDAEVASSGYTGTSGNINTAAALDIFEVNPRPQTGPVKMDGKVGLFQIYNGILTLAEVQNAYDSYKDRYIVTNGLQLYLQPEAYSGSGTSWTDSSDNTYTVTLVGAPSYNTSYFTFDGTTEYYDTNQSLGSETFSVGAWFRTSAAGIKMILSKETTAGWPWTYRIWMNGGTIVGDIAQTSGTNIGIQSVLTNYNNGNWYNVMFTRNDSSLWLYVNGVEVATVSDTLTGTIVNAQEVWFGRSAFTGGGSSPTGNYQYTGDLGECFIYNRVLTSTEILQNYNATKATYGL